MKKCCFQELSRGASLCLLSFDTGRWSRVWVRSPQSWKVRESGHAHDNRRHAEAMSFVIFLFLGPLGFCSFCSLLFCSKCRFIRYQSPPTMTAVIATAARTVMAAMIAAMVAATATTAGTTGTMMAVNIAPTLAVRFGNGAWLVTHRNVNPLYVWLESSPLDATAI